MNFIYVIHLLYWKHLTDLIIHSRSNRKNSIHCNNKGGRALPLFLEGMLLFRLFVLILLCMIRLVSWFQYNKWMT